MRETGLIDSICISSKKGERKYPVNSVIFEKNIGIKNDAHGDGGFRQVSFLSRERINGFAKDLSLKIDDGIFGENIITKGIDLSEFPLRSEFLLGDNVRIVIVKQGKTCHDKLCPIGLKTGKCIMPDVGTFGKVLSSGELRKGDMIKKARDKVYLVGFITISDRASSGAREDKTLSAIKEKLHGSEFDLIDHVIVPDESPEIEKAILNMTDFQFVDLVISSGGTGLSRRDITPDVTKSLIEREIPGIAEILRAESYKITPYASLSRGVSGTRKRSIIINLPGSPKAVSESIPILLPMLDHAIDKLQGDMSDCGGS